MTLQVTGDPPLRHMETTGAIIGCAFEVINELGVGFVESVYKKALLVALRQRGLEAHPEQSIQVRFRGASVGYFFADLLVEEAVIVELKAVKAIAQGHHAQMINYLAASGIEVGLLLNFGGPKLEFKRFTCPSIGPPPRARPPFSV